MRGAFASVLRFGLCLLEFGSEVLECFRRAVGLGLPGSELGLELADPCVCVLARPCTGLTRFVEFGVESVGAFAGCGFRVGGVFASVVSFGLRLLEFGSEPLECFGCAVGLGLSGRELGLELADPFVRGVTRCRGALVCVLEFGLQLLSAVVVLRGLRGGDVDEGLEVGGGARGFFRVLRELRF